ncbi:hypothetical protein BDR26DRAFT_851749 [Obelidium mucronatum]|nr:hypothetical protein BDR26DRAFT_851749 [Obelidium mucronatum]
MSSIAHPECVSIASTSICAPWTTDLYINTTALASTYNVAAIYVSDWEAYVARYSPAKDLGCSTGDTIVKTQFLTTYLCMRDVLVLSAGCNDVMGANTPSPALCSETCSYIGKGFESYLGDTTKCPSIPANSPFSEATSQARSNALEVAGKCHTVVSAWQEEVAKNGQNCLGSVIIDHRSCGLGANSTAKTLAFCKSTDYTPPCCESLTPSGFTRPSPSSVPTSSATPNSSDIDNNNNNHNSSSNNGPSAGAIAGIVIGSLLFLALLIAAAIYFARRNFKKSGIYSSSFTSSNAFAADPRSESSLFARKSALGGSGGGSGGGDYMPLSEFGTYKPVVRSSTNGSSFLPRIPQMAPLPFPLNTPPQQQQQQQQQQPQPQQQPQQQQDGASPKGFGVYKVILEYESQLPDELTLKPGDVVVVTEIHDDGWASGMKKGGDGPSVGVFPLPCIGLQ